MLSAKPDIKTSPMGLQCEPVAADIGPWPNLVHNYSAELRTVSNLSKQTKNAVRINIPLNVSL